MLASVQRFVRPLARRDVLALVSTIFLADLVAGTFSPTFSLYATSLGSSLTFVGILSSAAGLARIVASVPVGMLSDTRGRKVVLVSGMVLLAVTSFLYSIVSNPYWLLPIRMIHGVIITATFFVGMAYVGDLVSRADLGLVSGVYTTCMGLGFALGSGLGGKIAAELGYVTMFRLASSAALLGVLIAWRGLSATPRHPMGQLRALPLTAKLGLLLKEPQLLAASLGYMLIILMFDAAIVNFFPLYAQSLLISQATIGSMFAVRALVSASVRLPTGLLTNRFASRRLMIAALTLGTIMIFSICTLTDPVLLTFLLAGEGVCFGVFLTSGQAYINEHFSASERGTAMGVYSMTGSISATVGPFLLGAVADLWGLRSVFLFTGVLVFVGVVSFLYLSSRPSPPRSAAAGGEETSLIEA